MSTLPAILAAIVAAVVILATLAPIVAPVVRRAARTPGEILPGAYGVTWRRVAPYLAGVVVGRHARGCPDATGVSLPGRPACSRMPASGTACRTTTRRRARSSRTTPGSRARDPTRPADVSGLPGVSRTAGTGPARESGGRGPGALGGGAPGPPTPTRPRGT